MNSPRDFETEARRTDVRAVEVGRAADRAPLLLDAEDRRAPRRLDRFVLGVRLQLLKITTSF